MYFIAFQIAAIKSPGRPARSAAGEPFDIGMSSLAEGAGGTDTPPDARLRTG
jgi:hypothetical protein